VLKPPQGLEPVACRPHAMAHTFQDHARDFAHVVVVVHENDAAGATRIGGRREAHRNLHQPSATKGPASCPCKRGNSPNWGNSYHYLTDGDRRQDWRDSSQRWADAGQLLPSSCSHEAGRNGENLVGATLEVEVD